MADGANKIGSNRGNAGKGRPKGALNKATAEIKQAARKHGPDALKVLATLMKNAESEQAQIAAAKEILDRAYGKATQPIGEDSDMPFVSKAQRDAAVAAALLAGS